MPQPLVSVAVSSFNRPARLGRLLDSLGAQTLPPERFEVVVVDNGSQPSAAEVIERHAGKLRLRAIRFETTRGPGAARNAAWRAARAPLIAFTDDDCRASERWLEAGLRAARSHPGKILQGPTRPDPWDRAHAGLLARTQCIEAASSQYQTCNIFYPRELLERLDGFDESFGIEPAGEDTDLAWRALAAGAGVAFVPDAGVLHAVERIGMGGRLRVAARWSSVARIYREHPGTREMLYAGVFWNAWHYLLLRSLLALALPSLPRRILLARYLEVLRRRARQEGASPAQLPWAVPFLVVHDAVEMAALARGSLRQRTLVL